MKLCMLALPPHGSMTMHFHHADAIVQPLHFSSCFEHACTSPVIMARLEECEGLEFAAIPEARHWRPMTEMQQERAIDGSPVIYLERHTPRCTPMTTLQMASTGTDKKETRVTHDCMCHDSCVYAPCTLTHMDS